MDSPFVITASSNSVRIQGGRGEATVMVKNSSGRALKGRAEILPSKAEAAAWMSIAQNPERTFAPAAAEQFVVQLNIPKGAAEGDYSFQLRVADVADPNERLTIGPAVGFKVAAPPPPPRPFPMWIFAVIGVIFLVVAGGIVYWAINRKPATAAEIEVPDVTNKTISEARTFLESQGLALGQITRSVAAKPKDIILQQTPAAHKTAAKGGAIAVVASDENIVLVPALIGQTEDQAKDALGGLLDVEKVERGCSAASGAVNTIYESNPRTGDSVSRATKVLLRVKDDCVPVPRLIGADKASAFTQLNALGLLGNPVAGSIDPAKVDKVEDQSPAPDQLLAKGSQVTLKFYHLQPIWDFRIFEADLARQNQLKILNRVR
jgi:beta-lactam-binding protein with PASTA domain